MRYWNHTKNHRYAVETSLYAKNLRPGYLLLRTAYYGKGTFGRSRAPADQDPYDPKGFLKYRGRFATLRGDG
jgi:hypothetical protein